MASQFYGLNIAYTGLLASNAALNTTANNIANTETKGYSRQEINQTAGNAIRTYTTFGCSGSGVEVHDIKRVRDEFYDTKFWQNNGIYGEYEKKAYYMRQVEDYYADDEYVKGFTTIFNEMTAALQELMKNAGDSTIKAQFVGQAKNLSTYFNEMASNLEKIQEDVNSEIKVKVDEINSYAQEIASLNKQINVIELTGVTANELRDQRTVVVDKLSKVIDVEVRETPITDVNDPTRETGATRYLVRIAGGQILADGNDYNTLKCVAREGNEKAYQSDAEGLYDIQWENGSDFGMYNASMRGELFGLIQFRDGNNGEYFNGTATSIRKDSQGNSLVKIAVKDDYLKDMTKCTLPNAGIINIGNTLYKYSEWTFDKDTSTYQFKLDKADNEKEITSDKLHKSASTNHSVEYQGIVYYQAQMNEWLRLYTNAFNDILTQENSVDGYGDPAEILFTGMRGNSSELRFRAEGNSTINSNDDCYRALTAANFTINSKLIEDANRLATRTDASDGPDKYDVAEQLFKLRDDTTRMTYRGGSAGEYLQAVMGDVALNADRANTFSANAENMSNSIDNQRYSISGVDQDEEAVNLVKFQNAYNLSSKVIQVLTEIYDRLILETGV